MKIHRARNRPLNALQLFTILSNRAIITRGVTPLKLWFRKGNLYWQSDNYSVCAVSIRRLAAIYTMIYSRFVISQVCLQLAIYRLADRSAPIIGRGRTCTNIDFVSLIWGWSPRWDRLQTLRLTSRIADVTTCNHYDTYLCTNALRVSSTWIHPIPRQVLIFKRFHIVWL